MSDPNQVNPYLEPTNYYDGYNESIEKHKQNPELLAFSKLCYEVLHHNEQGKILLNFLKTNYVLPSLVNINAPQYKEQCVWSEGYKDAFRLLMKAVDTHIEYIKAETKST